MSKQFVYLVDDMDVLRVEKMKKALATIPEIEDIKISIGAATVNVMAKKDVEDQVKMAAGIARASFRRKV